MLNPTTTLADAQPIWWQALASPTGRTCALIALGCVAGIVVLSAVLRGLHPRPRIVAVRDEDGTATIEFALIFPFLLFLMMALAQTTMVMGGNMMVHYAAYTATRSAIVQVPRELADNGPNQYTQSEGSTKHDLVHEAAAIALVPFSGRVDSSRNTQLADRFSEGFGQYFSDTSEPNWTGDYAREKLNYALEQTEVVLGYPEVLDTETVEMVRLTNGETYTYANRGAITVFLTHRLYLGVPYVNRLFADGRVEGGKGSYVEVEADCTLTNEGMRDELPPMPTIPRTTPPPL